jgi:hypothetical protein
LRFISQSITSVYGGLGLASLVYNHTLTLLLFLSFLLMHEPLIITSTGDPQQKYYQHLRRSSCRCEIPPSSPAPALPASTLSLPPTTASQTPQLSYPDPSPHERSTRHTRLSPAILAPPSHEHQFLSLLPLNHSPERHVRSLTHMFLLREHLRAHCSGIVFPRLPILALLVSQYFPSERASRLLT